MAKVVENYVDRYIKRYHSKMQRICEPLQNFLGINYFTYHSLSSEGAWCPIVSRLDWADYYTESELYLQDPFLVHPRSYQSGAVMWHTLPDPYQQEILKYAGEKFDMAHGMILIEKGTDSCDFFGFTAPKSHGQIYSTYLNDLPLLKKFCQYFKEEMAPVIRMAQHDPVDLSGLKGEAFESHSCPFQSEHKPKNLFLKCIGAEPPIKLSRREGECLSLYLDDARMIDVAQKLDLSIRTVEAYLASIKSKLDCSNKAELLKKGQELRSLGIIR